MTPPTIAITVTLILLVFVLKPKHQLVPFVLCAVFVPADQRVIVADLDFTPLRLMVLAGFLSLVMRGHPLHIRLNRFDKLVLAWGACGAAIYIMQWMNVKAAINRSGFLFDVIGLYWLFRLHLSTWNDFERLARAFALCALALAPLVALEWATGQNPFTTLGTVRTAVREGRYRCQASFPHSIMMGVFWVGLLPVFAGLAYTRRSSLYWAAAAATVFMAIATASSTPVAALGVVLLVLPLYRFRHRVPMAAKLGVVGLFMLHMVMKAPVWHLIARIDLVGGSTGWHRYHLIDAAIRHAREWIVLGCRSTGHWGYGLQDVTNQYVLEGVRGGLITLILFCAMLFVAFKAFWRLSMFAGDRKGSILGWCLFVALVAHAASFMAVSYFGQIMMQWYMVLALGGFVYEQLAAPATAGQPVYFTSLEFQDGPFDHHRQLEHP